MTLGDFYRENGESEHLARLEAVLPEGWESTAAIASGAGVSTQFARKGLDYLLEEGRVERVRADDPAYKPRGWRWEWRRPA